MSGSLPPGTILLRSPQIAERAFGVTAPGQIMQSVPRVKFEFYVQFVLGPAALAMIGNSTYLNYYNSNRGMSFKVKQVDKPKVQLQTEELNQYNKKVLVYKKVEYSEASVRLHDTVDNSGLATWIDYFTFYFADSRLKANDQLNDSTPPAPFNQSPYDPQMKWDSGWGFQPIVNNDTHFFTGIIVYSLFANTYTAWEYVNPKITNIDFTNFDYSSSETDELNIQFKYEAIRYLAFGQPISNQQNLGFMPNFGFDTPDYINSPSSTVTTPSSGSPRIFTNTLSPIQTCSPQTPTPSNNISNPSGNIPTLCQSFASLNALSYATAGLAPGVQLPIPIPGVSSLINSVSFGGLPGNTQNANNSVLAPVNQAVVGAVNTVNNTINGAVNTISADINIAGAQAANYIDSLL